MNIRPLIGGQEPGIDWRQQPSDAFGRAAILVRVVPEIAKREAGKYLIGF
jgi:hypothetical protein